MTCAAIGPLSLYWDTDGMSDLFVAGKGDCYHSDRDCPGLRAGQTTADVHDWDRTQVRKMKACKCTTEPEVIDTADQAARLILAAIETVGNAGFAVLIDEGRLKLFRGSSHDPETAELWEEVPNEWQVGP